MAGLEPQITVILDVWAFFVPDGDFFDNGANRGSRRAKT